MRNRRIKFRAWDKLNAEMLQPGDINGNTKDLSWFFSQYEEANNGGNNIHLMQFTGLIDKNNKDIYEGDIIVIENKLHIIKYDKCQFEAYPMKSYANTLERFYNECSVIGNIYENPELLK